MILYLFLFALGTALDIALGWHQPAPDPLILARVLQGVRAGHLLLAVNVEQPRLIDFCVWLLALPMAPFMGWEKALGYAGLAFAPLCAGGLGSVCAWAVEPFAARRLLVFSLLAAVGFLFFDGIAVPGVVSPWLLSLVCLTGATGFLLRSYEPDNGPGFLAGLLSGFAVWLTPLAVPVVMAGFGAMMLRRWRAAPGALLATAGAGVLDVLGIGFTVDPPLGGYFGTDPYRMSLITVAFGLALLIGGAACWRLELKFLVRRARWMGAGVMAGLATLWTIGFYLAGGRILLPHPVLLPAVFGLAYTVWLAFSVRRGRAVWVYASLSLLAAAATGLQGVCIAAFALLVPLAGTELWRHLTKPPPKSPFGV